jgi:hypothetical protein
MTENASEQIVPTDRSHPYWVKGHADHESAVAAVASNFAAKYAAAPAGEPELVLDETGPDTPWQRVIHEANERAHAAALDKQIEAAMKTDAYKKGDPAAVAAVQKLFAQKYGEEEQGKLSHKWLFEEATAEELQKLAGVELTMAPGSEVDPFHAANYCAWVIENQIPSVVASSMAQFLYDAMVARGGVVDESFYAEFEQRFAKDLTKEQIELLMTWHKTEVMARQ